MTSKVTNITLRILAGFLLLSGAVAARAQATDPGPGCTPSKQGYICDKASFQRILKEARSIAIDVSPRDRIARKQLAELIVALGKSPADGSANLTFALAPPDPDGVNVGPSDQELATLRVYAPGSDGKRGNLLWAETYRGQADMRWPSVVHALIAQFQAKFARP